MSRRQPRDPTLDSAPERKPTEYEVVIKHKIYRVTGDRFFDSLPGLLRGFDSPLNAEFESVEDAAEAILKDPNSHNDEFVVLPLVRKRVKF